ncbi:MAG: NAD(P)-binding domain-containing protein [Ardenticatenaceae bacterium]|nr:NAD(P)-binding domain-containing protein [Ardenticatenaceae bacterium]
MNHQPTVGFIGLGIMGKSMALNLRKAGFSLVVHNRSRGAVEELVAAGATPAASSREVADRSDVILLCLPDSPDVVAVVRGENGVFTGARPGQIIVDHSTISPVVTRDLAAEAAALGLEWLDAPISGGDVGARSATLSIMVGGSAEVLSKVMPLMEAMGKTITHMGPVGAGQTIKATNQIVCSLHYAAMAEGLLLAKQAGLDLEKALRVLTGGYANSRILEVRGPKAIADNFQPGFKASLHLKDMKIALDSARDLDLPVPFTALAAQFFQALINRGEGDLDASALMRELARLNG